jgi:hypothetical protein
MKMVVQVIDAPDLAHSHILWIFPPYLAEVGEKDLNLWIETVMPGRAPMRHENGSWLDGMTETLIACRNGCTDMREAYFHIK